MILHSLFFFVYHRIPHSSSSIYRWNFHSSSSIPVSSGVIKHGLLEIGPCIVDFPIKNWLVVYLPLWKIWKSVGMIIPSIWKNNTCSKPPTRKPLFGAGISQPAPLPWWNQRIFPTAKASVLEAPPADSAYVEIAKAWWLWAVWISFLLGEYEIIS